MSITIENFVKRLDSYGRQFPGDAEASLKKGAARMRKKLQKASPTGKAVRRHKLNKSWKLEMKGYNFKSLQAEISSTASHFHLVNRGHKDCYKRIGDSIG